MRKAQRSVMALAIVAMCAGLVRATPAAATATPTSLEYPIKAAYLLNFAKLTEWPREAFPRADSPITIGILGADPFGQTLDLTVEGKKISKRAIVVKRLQWGQDPRQCHILFLSAVDGNRIGEVATRVAGLPVLIVGETPDLARRGATINFKIEDGRVRFEVNVEAARRARLTISSQVLTYARIVKDH